MEEIPKLIFGTMNFGPQVNTQDSLKMVKHFLNLGYNEIDTAYVYNEGETEKILGTVLSQIPENSLSVATKVNPRITGKLDADAVKMQFNESLRRLKKDMVDVLYFHFPDAQTPVESALEACNQLYQQGKIKEFGLSNFPAWKVVDIWHLCKEHGWLVPAVYQGRYNGLSRNVESELFPAIRKLGIRFYAYNPLAGGMLTGKHLNFEESPKPGRFERLKSYRDRYWKKSYFEAVNFLSSKCKELNIPPVEAAYRWLGFHSYLDPSKKDGIIIGASTISQLEQNLSVLKKGRLPEEIISAFDAAWGEAETDSPEYFNFYSRQ